MNAEERKQILAGKGVRRKAIRREDLKSGSATDEKQEREMTFGEHVWSWTKTIISSLLIVMVVNGLLVASFVVPTGSMENEVMTGDFLFVNKFIYGGSSPQTIPFLDIPLPFFRLPGLRDPQKGDVIVFIYPGLRDEVEPDQFQYYLKRMMAGPGDTLEVRENQVYVDGELQPVPPNAIFNENGCQGRPQDMFPPYSNNSCSNWGPMRIPKKGDVIPLTLENYHAYSVLIQREGHTIDQVGQLFSIDGEPATSYTIERDYAFGMGDNRDNSSDSRFWGFIPMENIVGTPLMVYWSWNPNIPLLGDPIEKIKSIRWDRIFNTVE